MGSDQPPFVAPSRSPVLRVHFEPRGEGLGAWLARDRFSERIPELMDSLPSDRAMQGSTLSDATIVVTALRQAISDFEWTVLEAICRERGVLFLPGMRVSFQEELAEILDDFMLHWIVGDSARGFHVTSLSHRLLQNALQLRRRAFHSGKHHEVRKLSIDAHSTGMATESFENSIGSYTGTSRPVDRSFTALPPGTENMFWPGHMTTITVNSNFIERLCQGNVVIFFWKATAAI